MTGRKSSGGEQGSGDDHVIEFTPEGAFDIRSAAKNFSRMMEDSNQSLIIHLPHVSVEFEPGCTPEEIIDGYHQGLRHKFVIHHSNTNAGKKPPPAPK
jgi:hypothetical protein